MHCTCGALLLEGTDRTGVTLVGGEYIRFTRKTDFVVCPECLSVYKAGDLLASEGFAEYDEDDEDDEDDELRTVETLERMVESELDTETKPEG